MFSGNEKRWSKLALLLVFSVTVVCCFRIYKLDFNYDFESFFPTNDPDLAFYDHHRKLFESDNDFLLIAIQNDKGIFKETFLQNLHSCTQEIKELSDVTQIQSPTTLARLINGPLGPIEVPYVHFDNPKMYFYDSLSVFREQHLVGTFFSDSLPAVCMFIKHTPYLSKVKSDSLLQQIETIVDDYAFNEVHYAGRVHGQHYYIKKIKKEMIVFMIASFLLVLAFLVWTFRNWRAVIVPLVVVLLSMGWLFGIMAHLETGIDVIATIIPTILFVVGMSDSIHFFTRYFDLIRNNHSVISSVKTTIKEVGKATFLTSLTTAIGFATLTTASIMPVKRFGVLTSSGVFIAFLLTYLIVPSTFILFGKKSLPKRRNVQYQWRKVLNKIFYFIIKRQKAIMIGSIALFVVSVIGLLNVRVDSFLLEDLSKKDEIRQSYSYIEDVFAGARPFELAIYVDSNRGESFLHYEHLKKINEVERYLQSEYGVNALLSVNVLIKNINRLQHGGYLAHYRFPENEREFNKCKKMLMKYGRQLGVKQLISEDGKYLRITGKIKDYGAVKTKEKNKELSQFIEKNVALEAQHKVTGMATLVNKNIEYLIHNLLIGLGFSFLMVSLIMAFIYRSFWMVIISLVPNILPILMISSILGVANIHLNATTSIVFTIAFGIAVDDTIHFLSKLKSDLQKFKSPVYALRNTFLTTGRALIVTTLILSGGFLTLMASGFNSIFKIGLLISLTLIFALVIDLLWLPVLILRWKRGYRGN